MARYHELSIAEKQAHALANVREQPVACPSCDTKLMPSDLISHLDRCGGHEPGPRDKWITHSQALALGVKRQTLSYWVKTKWVRTNNAGRGDRQYLERDLVKRIAFRKVIRRR